MIRNVYSRTIETEEPTQTLEYDVLHGGYSRPYGDSDQPIEVVPAFVIVSMAEEINKLEERLQEMEEWRKGIDELIRLAKERRAQQKLPY